MKRMLPYLAFILFLFAALPSVSLAQIKGNPSFPGVAANATVEKSTSTLSPELQQLSPSPKAGQKIAEATTKPKPPGAGNYTGYLQLKGGNVLVDITAKDDIASAMAELRRLGATVTASYGRVISASIPISALPQLEGSATIRFARPAYKPMHAGGGDALRVRGGSDAYGSEALRVSRTFAAAPPKTGRPPVVSEGDTAQLSYIARNTYHVNGKGVKVGVLSDSYNDLGTADSGIAIGVLPGKGNPFGYKTPVQVLEDLDSGGTDEGRAMMEIVHSVAPGSPLAFHTAQNGQADFANGILQLANSGCSVIGDDVYYFAEPFFQDGILAQAVDQVKRQGVAYFSAAGNESLRGYTSFYRGSDYEPFGHGVGTAHNFSGAGDPPRYFQPIYIPPGGVFITSFQWDQSSFTASGVGDSTDMDIYLLDGNGNIVAAGNSDNLASGDPIEVFGYQNLSNNVTFYLAILKYAGPDPNQLKYILYDDALFYITNPAIPGILTNTLVGHAKADGAIAVGAAWYKQCPPYGVTPPEVERYSSVGGVPNYYDIQGNRIPPLVRKKPEIVAPDGVSTSFFNPFNEAVPAGGYPPFFGTSAATPHAAGVAALMIEANRIHTLTPGQIKGVMEANTWGMADPYTAGSDTSFNYTTGYGLIKAPGAVGEVKFPNSYVQPLKLAALCSPDPGKIRNWKVSNPNPFEITVSWFVVGSNQQGSFTLAPGDTSFSTTAIYGNAGPLPVVAGITWQDNFDFPHFDLSYSTRAVCGKDSVTAANSDAFGATTAAGKSLATSARPTIAEVYPNPSTGVFRLYLSVDQPQNVILTLYSADGRELQTQRAGAAMSVIDIDATAYRPGVYFLKVIQGGEVKTMKLVKQ